MITANPTKEEELMKEAARVVVDKAAKGKKPEIRAKELEDIAVKLEFSAQEIEDFIAYLQTPQGKESFKKTVRLEMLRAGYGPRR